MREPRSFSLSAQTTALVVIDVQERLARAMEPRLLEQLVANVGRLTAAAVHLRVPVLVTEQYPEGLGPTLAGLTPEAAVTTPKMEFDAAKNPTFMERLHGTGAKSVILAGIEAHICVAQTALSLVAGYDVWVARDAIASRTQANYEGGASLMHDGGAVLAPTESILFWMLERAGTPEFKAISKLVR